MSVNQLSVKAMIARARLGEMGLGPLLERYRGFLLTESQRQIGRRLAVRTDADDIVQDTFLKAVRRFDQFAGTTEPEFTAWIRAIHANALRDLLRKLGMTDGRLLVERSWCGDSASLVWNEPVADQSTPSQRLIRAERALHLAEAIQALPEAQREAVRLRHLEGRPLESIAAELGRSVAATASLIKRGVEALRTALAQDTWMSANPR